MNEQIQILINGEKKELNAVSIFELLREMSLPSLDFGVAVMLNGNILDKTRWSYIIQSNDKIEVVRAFQGG